MLQWTPEGPTRPYSLQSASFSLGARGLPTTLRTFILTLHLYVTLRQRLCAAVVHRDYENAAVYSNVGREECWAVFEAAGVIYDPVLRTCVFEQ